MFKRYIIACALVSCAVAYNDSQFQVERLDDETIAFDGERGFSRDYIASKYGVDDIDVLSTKRAAQLEAALGKAIDAMDKRGIPAICELIRDSGVKLALLPMLERFESAVSRAWRGTLVKSGLTTLAGVGCAYAGLKMLHKPAIQISMPAYLGANTLLLGTCGAALWTVYNVAIGKRQIRRGADRILECLLERNALIVGGDHLAIDVVLARILKKLN